MRHKKDSGVKPRRYLQQVTGRCVASGGRKEKTGSRTPQRSKPVGISPSVADRWADETILVENLNVFVFLFQTHGSCFPEIDRRVRRPRGRLRISVFGKRVIVGRTENSVRV